MLLLFHTLLAASLFVLQNWIGERSYSKGYIRFSLFDDKNEDLSYNYAIKAFGPVIYLIICVAICQYFEWTEVTEKIYRVVFIYLAIRLFAIIIYERTRIVNWPRIGFHYLTTIILTNVIYDNFITQVQFLLPDFSQIKNEIWLLIIIFIFQLGQRQHEAADILKENVKVLYEIKRRKKKYIIRQYEKISSTFDPQIKQVSENDESFNMLIVGILIYENFNRPKLIRMLEKNWVRLTGKAATQGIMQVLTNEVISDSDSVEFGTSNLFSDYHIYKKKSDKYVFRKTIKRQCPDIIYIHQVLLILKAIIDELEMHDTYYDIYDEIQDEFNLIKLY